MILLSTIQKNLLKFKTHKELRYEFDIRYLEKWVNLYPSCFPKYVINNNYKIVFNSNKLRYELHRNA